MRPAVPYDNTRHEKKQQLYTRLGPEATERVIRRFNDHEITLQETVDAIGVGKTRVYDLRTQWLAVGKEATFLGISGEGHAKDWPGDAVEHQKSLIQAAIKSQVLHVL